MIVKKCFDVELVRVPQSALEIDHVAHMLIVAAQEPHCRGVECEYDRVTLYVEPHYTVEQVREAYQRAKSRQLFDPTFFERARQIGRARRT